MELLGKILEQTTSNTIPKIEEHMLIVMDKPTHEENLFQPLQTNSEQFKIAITFITGYNGIFSVTNSNNKFYFKKTITSGDDFIQNNIPQGAYEIKSLNSEIKRIIIDEEHYTESDYSFQIKPSFSTLGSRIEISPQGPIIGFVFYDSIRNLLGFHETILYKEYNLSPNPVDILSVVNNFLEYGIAKAMIYKQNRSGIIQIRIMTVNPGYNYVESFAGGITWYMMETKDVFSSFSFELKNEINELISYNGQSVSFRLSINEV